MTKPIKKTFSILAIAMAVGLMLSLPGQAQQADTAVPDIASYVDSAAQRSGQDYFEAKQMVVAAGIDKAHFEQVMSQEDISFDKKMMLLALSHSASDRDADERWNELIATACDAKLDAQVLKPEVAALWYEDIQKIDNDSEAANVLSAMNAKPGYLYELLVKHTTESFLDHIAPAMVERINARPQPAGANRTITVEDWRARYSRRGEMLFTRCQTLAARALAYKTTDEGVQMLEVAGMSDSLYLSRQVLVLLKQIESDKAEEAARRVSLHLEKILSEQEEKSE